MTTPPSSDLLSPEDRDFLDREMMKFRTSFDLNIDELRQLCYDYRTEFAEQYGGYWISDHIFQGLSMK